MCPEPPVEKNESGHSPRRMKKGKQPLSRGYLFLTLDWIIRNDKKGSALELQRVLPARSRLSLRLPN